MTDFTKETLPTPAARRPIEPVDALGGRLYVRRISAGEAAKLPEDGEAFLGELMVKCVVFGDGSPVWETQEQALEYPMTDLSPLIVAAIKVNKLGEKAVEEAKGN